MNKIILPFAFIYILMGGTAAYAQGTGLHKRMDINTSTFRGMCLHIKKLGGSKWVPCFHNESTLSDSAA
jgi:hypothetical protein